LHITKYIAGPITANKTESVQTTIMEHGMGKDLEWKALNKLHRIRKFFRATDILTQYHGIISIV